MPQYTVKSTIRHDHETYKPGSTIELTEKQAAEIPWALEPKKAPKTEDPDPKKAGKKS